MDQSLNVHPGNIGNMIVTCSIVLQILEIEISDTLTILERLQTVVKYLLMILEMRAAGGRFPLLSRAAVFVASSFVTCPI